MLQTMKEGMPRGKYVHHATDEWIITSHFTIESVLQCDLVRTSFPGLLGAYIYPADAVLHLQNGMPARSVHVEEFINRERARIRDAAETGIVTQQTTVVIEPPCVNNHKDESDVDDETDDEKNDSVLDETEILNLDDDDSDTELPELIEHAQ